jgi:hypothetical protein
MSRKPLLRLNTREILQFACDFAIKFMDAKAADDDHIPMVHPESGGISGPGPAFRQFASIGAEIAPHCSAVSVTVALPLLLRESSLFP